MALPETSERLAARPGGAATHGLWQTCQDGPVTAKPCKMAIRCHSASIACLNSWCPSDEAQLASPILSGNPEPLTSSRTH